MWQSQDTGATQNWHRPQKAGISHPKLKRKPKEKLKKRHLAELVLTVVIDGVGNQRRKGYRVVAVLIRKESLEAESDDVEVVLVDVVQLLLRH